MPYEKRTLRVAFDAKPKRTLNVVPDETRVISSMFRWSIGMEAGLQAQDARHFNSICVSVFGTNGERMLVYLNSSLFDSPAQTLVNTVNTVGVMGKGIAKTFRERYPAMFSEYRELCDSGRLNIGNLHLWKGDGHWVLNFPTKTNWRLPSKIEYIQRGLQTFVLNYERMGITSASFPPLGCGNGNLNWVDVKPIIEGYLRNISIPIYVHDIHVGDEFVPEHKENALAPSTLDTFWNDLRASIYANKGTFATGDGEQQFTVKLDNEAIYILRGGRHREKIPIAEIENAWLTLRDGVLSIDRYSDEASRRYKSYLFPLLRSLPYVRSARVSTTGRGGLSTAQALFFARSTSRSEDAQVTEPRQQCLSL
jgi:O-acetyl-ADP-ribose deacetylase (regulator of RNase III)